MPEAATGIDFRERAAGYARELLTQLRPLLADDAWFDRAWRAAAYPWPRSYRRPHPTLVGMHDQAPEAVRSLFNRWLVVKLVEMFDDSRAPVKAPPTVRALYPSECERILAQSESLPDEHFSLANDAFLKDLGLLSTRLLPVGLYVCDPFGRLPARLGLKHGLGQAASFTRMALFEMRGLAPVLTSHIHELATQHLSEETWTPAHLRQAEILQANPRLRAVAGASWACDPRIAEITPHLAFVGEGPLVAGGYRFYLRPDPPEESGALETSRTRRTLFEKGQYTPEVWVAIISRPRLLRWAEQTQRDLAAGRKPAVRLSGQTPRAPGP